MLDIVGKLKALLLSFFLSLAFFLSLCVEHNTLVIVNICNHSDYKIREGLQVYLFILSLATGKGGMLSRLIIQKIYIL
jgi:hypothetical protein